MHSVKSGFTSGSAITYSVRPILPNNQNHRGQNSKMLGERGAPHFLGHQWLAILRGFFEMVSAEKISTSRLGRQAMR
jgi:hypothetical protein